MEIRPYLTFDGECGEALALYQRAFQTEPPLVLRFSDLPPDIARMMPENYQNRVAQATLSLGGSFLRLSDCGPTQALSAPESERISIVVETDVEQVRVAFAVLAEEGRVGMELAQTFYSPLAGVVFDKFGVMWNFVGTPLHESP